MIKILKENNNKKIYYYYLTKKDIKKSIYKYGLFSKSILSKINIINNNKINLIDTIKVNNKTNIKILYSIKYNNNYKDYIKKDNFYCYKNISYTYNNNKLYFNNTYLKYKNGKWIEDYNNKVFKVIDFNNNNKSMTLLAIKKYIKFYNMQYAVIDYDFIKQYNFDKIKIEKILRKIGINISIDTIFKLLFTDNNILFDIFSKKILSIKEKNKILYYGKLSIYNIKNFRRLL